MATASKSAFDVNIQRARYFLQIHEDAQQGAGAPLRRHRELPRAAIVFAVGALDAYLSELSAEVLVSQLGRATPKNVARQNARDVLLRVQKEVPTLAVEVALVGKQTERLGYIQRAVADYFHNTVSNHGSTAVSATLLRIGGNPSDLWSALTEAGGPDPRLQLDTWTEKRHQIVHQGQKPTVHRPQAQSFIDFAVSLVRRLDEIADPLK